YRRAALWTGQTNVAEAARHWQKVRALAAGLPESEETVQLAWEAIWGVLNAAWQMGMPDDEAEILFADARALAERARDPRSPAILTAFYGAIKANQGDMPSYFAHTFESLRLAEQTGDPVLIGTVHDAVIWSHALLGQLAAAEEAHTRALAL